MLGLQSASHRETFPGGRGREGRSNQEQLVLLHGPVCGLLCQPPHLFPVQCHLLHRVHLHYRVTVQQCHHSYCARKLLYIIVIFIDVEFD